ncbi:DUF6079 family protein [Euzebya sp.]|uniref:DUF6079 family protein n=1 Tax=Euzebya sp. TaxID=1971409 RepID=UPI003516D108
MKYRDVIDIPPPLEQVKQVRDSASEDKARRDVETYVISDRMADQLTTLVLPHLRFDQPSDNRGLFIVGTYGTGKTHLMAVIAGIAEFPDLLDVVTKETVRTALEPLRGTFQVIRFDIGASGMSLRDIVCQELTKGLAAMGVDYQFPPFDQVSGTKDHLVEMMAAFEAVYPDKGLLFALDELLDYLRGRKDAELFQDLAFLREVGESSKNSRFRTLIGLQESLFDNPRFQGAASAVQRVKARFEQLRISKEDVSFVVKHRLLPKSPTQRDRIRDHLTTFTPLYDGMAERLEDFVDLFPVHPSYLGTFEQLRLVEKREILRTIQDEILRLADQQVPDDQPGLVCLDSYRQRMDDDPGARMVPEVAEVLDKSEDVRTKVQSALPEKEFIPTATRLLDALAVHRMTTEDTRSKIGMTIEELRDQVLPLPPGLPKKDASFLRITLESILQKTLVAVSGEYISKNQDNGQYYLDLDKDVDYDQLIAQRAESLDDNRLDEAYYVAMEETLGVRDDPYKGAYKTWEYDLSWPEKKSERRGYLFMGAPNQRSTAKPPRDFYLFFIQPYDPPKFFDEEQSDEVLQRLAAPDDTFRSVLKRYAGALALAKESTGERRPIYDAKAQAARQELVTWLRTNMRDAVTLTYKGETRTLAEWLHEVPEPATSIREQLRAVWSHILTDHFRQRYPGYPTFTVEVTPGNVMEAARAGLNQLATPAKSTSTSRAVLSALGLLDHTGTINADGTYAAALLKFLDDAAPKVLNRTDLLTQRDPGLWSWSPWHLEPEWLVVVAAALVHLGHAELAYPGQTIDALSLGELAKKPQDELVAFSHIAPPAATPTDALKAAATLLDVAPGAVPATGATTDLVTTFGTRAVELQSRISEFEDVVADGIEFWGDQLVDLREERRHRIRGLKAFVEDIVPRNSIGKLNKLNLPPAQIEAATAGKDEIAYLDLLRKSATKLAGVASYLREAVSAFGEHHSLSDDAKALREDMLATLQSTPIDPAAVSTLTSRADELRQDFAKAAAAAYTHNYLDAAGDKRKEQLRTSPEWIVVERLATIKMLPGGVFTTLKQELADIPTIMSLDASALTTSVIHQGRQPGTLEGTSADARLEQLETRVLELYEGWTATLAENLAEPDLQEQIGLLDAGVRDAVEHFRDTGTLPDPVTVEFVKAVDLVFKRFEIRTVSTADLSAALFPGSSPAAPEELRARLDGLLETLLDGHTPDRTRIVLAPETDA